jgi:hypothetical protein
MPPAVAPKPILAQRYGPRRCPIRCPRYEQSIVSSLGEFLDVCYSFLDPSKVFWFRGHSQAKFALVPRALRYTHRASSHLDHGGIEAK